MTAFIPYLVIPVLCGLLAKFIKLPPLLGFLLSGIVLNLMGYHSLPIITELGELGVTLLLFTIGLKLDARLLLRTEVWLTSSLHMGITTLTGAALILFLGLLGLGGAGELTMLQAATLGFALSFSSTVLVAKVLEERSDSRALYGRTALGILIIQDLFAVLFMALTGGHAPSLWVFALLLLLPASWLFRKGLSRVGHGELLVLYGIVLAFVPGYWLFDLVGLKGDLGALVIGMLVASHPKSNELSHILMSLKEFMLIGFFVSIGLAGVPSVSQIGFAVALLLLLPVNTFAYAWILRLTGLSPRTSTLASLTLTNFSEFCIIVIAMAAGTGILDEQWTVTFSLAVSLSFVVATLVNLRGSKLPKFLAGTLPAVKPGKEHPEERPVVLGDVQAVIFGMGRIGRSTYDELTQRYQLRVCGIDSSETRVEKLQADGYNVVEADATDETFWRRVKDDQNIKLVVLAMPVHGSNIDAMKNALAAQSNCAFVAVAQYIDELRELNAMGTDSVVNLYHGAGETLAEHAYGAFIEKHHPKTGPLVMIPPKK